MAEVIPDPSDQPSTDPQPPSASSLLPEIHRLLGQKDNIDLRQLQTLYDQLKIAAPSSPDISALSDAIALAARKQREKEAYAITRKLCLDLWDREQELLTANVAGEEIVNQLFKPAVDNVLGALNAFGEPKSLLLQGLLNEARSRYDSARRRLEGKSTLDQTKDYQTYIEDLQAQHPDDLIAWSERGEPRPPKKAGEALLLVQREAQRFAGSKADEYQGFAQEALDKRNEPRSAQDWINKALALYLLGDNDRARLNAFLERNVVPALEKQGTAEKLLRQAEDSDDPRDGWKSLRAANQQYRWVGRLAEVTRALITRIIDRAEEWAGAAGAHIANFEHSRSKSELDAARTTSELAESYLETIKDYMQGHDDPADLKARFAEVVTLVTATLTRCKSLEDEVRDLSALAARLEDKLKHGDKSIGKIWKEKEAKYGLAAMEALDELRELRYNIAQAEGAAAVIERLEAVFNAGDIGRLGEAEKEGQKALRGITEPTSMAALSGILEKIQIRKRYKQALKLDSDAQLTSALREFKWVAKQANHPDAADALEQVHAIEKAEDHKAQVEKAIAEARASLDGAPRQAYQLLARAGQFRTTSTKALLDLKEKARAKWEKKATAELEKALDSKPTNANRLATLIQELSEELPEPRPIFMIERARAEASAIHARAQVQKGNWTKAEEFWRTALEHDSSRDEIREGLQQAIIRQAEEKLNLSLDQLSAAQVEALVTEFSRSPEVWILKARREGMQAAELSREAQERLGLYETAGRDLGQARDIVVSQQQELAQDENEKPRQKANQSQRAAKGPRRARAAVTERKIAQLAGEIRRGLDLTRRELAVERKMQPDRGREDYEHAAKDASDLITAESADPAVAQWWTAARERAVQRLAEAAREPPENEVSRILGLDLKVRVLDPNHERAVALRRKLPQLLDAMRQEVDRRVGDRNGLQVEDKDGHRIVDLQVDSLAQLGDRVHDAEALLDEFGLVYLERQALRQSIGRLSSLVGELEHLQHQTLQADRALRSSKRTGDWHDFDEFIMDLSTRGFGAHRTVAALRDERTAVNSKRAELQAMIQGIITLCEEPSGRSVALALEAMNTYETELDPIDEYGFRAAITVKAPPLGDGKVMPKKAGWQQVKIWLHSQSVQIDAVKSWLIKCGLIEVLHSQAVPVGPVRAEDPEGIIDWDHLKTEVKTLLDRGDYVKGLALVKMAQGEEDSEWADPAKKLLALQPARRRFLARPVAQTDLVNELARSLLSASRAPGQQVIQDAEDCEALRATTMTKSKEWETAFADLGHAFDELGELVDGRGLLRSKSKIELAKTRVNRAIEVCRQIAPNNPHIQAVRENQLLKA